MIATVDWVFALLSLLLLALLLVVSWRLGDGDDDDDDNDGQGLCKHIAPTTFLILVQAHIFMGTLDRVCWVQRGRGVGEGIVFRAEEQ